MENNLPEIVAGYLAAMHDIMQDDPEMRKDILENDYVDQKVYWNLFETMAMENYANNDGDPALTPEQFKTCMIEAMKADIEKTMQELVKKGLVEETDEGFKATEEVILAMKNTLNKG